jgi:hypothetical protein
MQLHCPKTLKETYFQSKIFVGGMFKETLSLKYLCLFYAMMIAILLASALSIDPSTQNEPK